MEYLPDLLLSIEAQTYRDFVVMVIDNGSTDHVDEFLRDTYPSVRLIRNARNLGFCDAHNQGIRYAIDHWEGEDLNNKFVLVTNPDIIFSPTYLETLLSSVPDHPTMGAFGGKLLRAYGERLTEEVLKEVVHSDRIDSTGIRVHKNLTFTDRGAGELDRGQFDEAQGVFGISGALVLYRAKSLTSVQYQGEYFDHDFFAYKEDVDLAWRLHYAGWGAWYEPGAVAYHYRGMYGQERMSIWKRIRNRQKKSRVRSYFSTRNHWLLLFKNADVASCIVLGPRVFLTELARFFYIVFFESSNSKSIPHAFRLFPRMWKKRRQIQKTKAVSGSAIRKAFV